MRGFRCWTVAAISLQVNTLHTRRTRVIAQQQPPIKHNEKADHCVDQKNETNESSCTIDSPPKKNNDNNVSRCKLYLAESTIPNAGLGMYTAVNVEEGSQVGYGDIVIPLIEFEYHNLQPVRTKTHNSWFLWYEYTWTFESLGNDFDREVQSADLHGCVPGFGAAINCHPGLINVEEGEPEYDTASLHRRADPGSGAFTPYHGRPNYVVADAPAGAELFSNYGEDWFKARTELGLIPLMGDYEIVDGLLAKYRSFMERVAQSSRGSEMSHDLWEIMSNLPYEGRTSNALPKSFRDAEVAIDVGSAGLHLPGSVRSLDWLEANGKCMDNIRPGDSSIPQAGRGAFATRFIPKGGLVAPAPLIHIPDRSVLNMHDGASSVVGKQLLLNYCFGHRNSTLLLSPYGATTGLINHDSHAPNAEISWADGGGSTNQNEDWWDLPVTDLMQKKHAGLSFDFIATRDIQPGEEVLIDYGPEWEEAWREHVNGWVAPEGAENYARASVLNGDTNSPLRTEYEQQTEPYPDNVELKFVPNWKSREDDEVLDTWSTRHCKILARLDVKGETLYDVKVSGKSGIMRVRREALVFVDRPYSSDIHLRNAFRHEMMVPDEMFPAAWMNR